MGDRGVAERLREIRESLGLSQGEFAQSIGVHRVTYNNYERGKSEPPLSVIKEIVQRYNVNPTWLLTGEGEPFQEEGRRVEVDPEVLELARVLQEEIDRIAEEIAEQFLQDFSKRLFESEILRPTLAHRIKIRLLEKAKEQKNPPEPGQSGSGA